MTKYEYIRLTWDRGDEFEYSRLYRVQQIIIGWRQGFNLLTEI